jgi:hypothetical protein
MKENISYKRIKVGKRYWVFGVIQGAVPIEDAKALFVDDQHSLDLLLIVSDDERLRQEWIDAVTVRQRDAWKALLISDVRVLLTDESLFGPALIFGPEHLVSRLSHSLRMNEEAAEQDIELESSTPFPEFLDPFDIPRFPQEGKIDPFGLNYQKQENTWVAAASSIGRLVKRAHAFGMAVTLPSALPGTAEPYLKPWRTVVPLTTPASDSDVAELGSRSDTPLSEVKRHDEWLGIVQRYLVTLAALSTRGADEGFLHDAAQVLEEFGYLLVSHIDPERLPTELATHFEYGALVARVHADNYVFADLHKGNIGFPPATKLPLGWRAICIDRGRDAIVGPISRSLTVLERAKNLAMLKIFCTFIQWEAVKCGYQYQEPEQAQEVFQLI